MIFKNEEMKMSQNLNSMKLKQQIFVRKSQITNLTERVKKKVKRSAHVDYSKVFSLKKHP